MLLPLLIALQMTAASAANGTPPGEQRVDPYVQNDANAGATPFEGEAMWRTFHEQPGVDRIVDRFVDLLVKDRRISDIFQGQDIVRLRRTLKEQFCYILNGGCHYTGRDMTESHRNLGIQASDFGALVEDLQKAMSAEHVPYGAQSSFLAKLAPMKKAAVQR